MRRVGIFCSFHALIAALLAACGGVTTAPISEKPAARKTPVEVTRRGVSRTAKPVVRRADTYAVVSGDTLHSIAWKFGLNYRDLARWNNLRDADLIYVGQRLRLKPPPNTAARKAPSKPNVAAAKPARGKSPSSPKGIVRKVRWRWPAEGTVRKATSALGSKGIEILGRRRAKIVAAGPGKVVYSGSGLRGYGNLIIIKHNETFLSAYAHNDELLVSEGAIIKDGQAIALMGNSGTKRVMLHFEIRRDGKAVEPLNYLPRR